MMIADIILLITAVGGLGGTVYALLKVRTEKRKLGADAAQVLSQSAIGLLEPMNKQVDVLEARLDLCNKKIDQLNSELDATRRENRILREQVHDLMEEIRTYRKENPSS
jgi:uncharacterized coiled-coil DUF342 family protein